MRVRRFLFDLAMAWLTIGCAVSYSRELAAVDPVLQAQWAEEVPAGEMVADDYYSDSTLECADAVDCGAEIGMASLIEPDVRLQGRWSVLAELTVLRPTYSASSFSTDNEDATIGPRLSIGWESADGFGIRGRGWGFTNGADDEGAPSPSSSSNYYTYSSISSEEITFSGGRFDLDFYQRLELQRGFLSFGASLTAAELKLDERYTVTQSGYYYQYANYPYYDYHPVPYTTSYEGGGLLRNRGFGLGLLVEGAHRFHETEFDVWSIFGRGRLAYLVGQWEDEEGGSVWEGDGNMTIGEAALGLEYRRKFTRADVFAQCAFEVQSWDVSGASRVNFTGVTTGVGVTW
jgi:hypothetical protein